MIELNEKERYDTVYPFVMEKDRESQNPSIIDIKLFRPERINYYIARMQGCVEVRGRSGRQELNPGKLTGVEIERLLEGIQAFRNFKINGEVKEIISDKDGKLAVINILDESERSEIGEACTKFEALSAGVKKN